MERFDHTYSYKLIYVFSIPDRNHEGLLKVGEATLRTDTNPDLLVPNCRELNQAAKARINSYTRTASVSYTLNHTELALYTADGHEHSFKDKEVHRVLMNSGVHKVQPNGETGEEWFATNLDTAKAAIQAVKNRRRSLTSFEMAPATERQSPIDFRDEQKDAVDKTLKNFKKHNEMLWYAKMRFGKTLTALEVVRRSQYRRVIIVTHRPVVDDGWSEDFKKIFFPGNSEHEYLYERKTFDSYDSFDEKTDSENDAKIRRMNANGDYFIYFASMQDLRGSKRVGGNFNKNNAVFNLDWDMIIIDEAHEGTQTELGDSVIKLLRKDHTKVLALSGTPFNLLAQYEEDSVYTWDYVMEQKKKNEWDLLHCGDHNPYADLPKMHIYTYDLGEKLKKYISDDYGSKAFNFREFFRVWYKGPNSKRELPQGAVEGNFVHENDIRSFLNLMTTEDTESGYPFSTQEYRDMFRHTLWMVPGVKEAKALSEMLRKHPVFGHFGIANVAGEGDKYEEEHSKDALDLVRKTIKDNEYSITLSCGKLTTGVTVKEWTAVLMLSGSYSTAAAQYMQTIFRVQSAGDIEGKQKTDCYVFDFAPDRTLKVLTETVHLSRKPGKNQHKRREAMSEFLNYCPVIAISGSHTKKYSVESMMEQIKQIYAERAVNSGFDDESIYSDELLKIDNIDASKFNHLKDIIGASKAQKKKDEVVVNGQGLTDEQIEMINDDPDDTTTAPEPLTPEQIAEKLAKKQAKEARKKAIDILRGISIRMPLMIYGADVPIDEDIDIERFVTLVDDTSWEEFMPKGVTKELFAEFTKYYDRDVFIAAGKRIRKLAAAADKETPTRRVQMIAEIFRHFKNPDKETVLTPWRVVNMHMSDTLGGWCFFNDQFEDDTSEAKHRLEEPRFVDRGDVTKKVFRDDAKILEINSKTGLYPLYVAYSVYRQKLEDTTDEDWDPEDLQQWWEEVLRNNVFVICKTPMAKSITKRTLTGYKGSTVNAHYFDDLINMIKEKPDHFKQKVLRCDYWKRGVNGTMMFDAVVGNPPYQVSDGGAQASAIPVYNLFVTAAKSLAPNYISMIMPSRWMTGGRGLDSFRSNMIHDKHILVLHDFVSSKDLFPTVEIKGGVCYFMRDDNKEDLCDIYQHAAMTTNYSKRYLVEEGDEIFIRNNELISIKEKVEARNDKSFEEIVSPLRPFGLRGDVFKDFRKYDLPNMSATPIENGLVVYGLDEKLKRTTLFAPLSYPIPVKTYIDGYKLFMSRNQGTGLFGEEFSLPIFAHPNECCTETFVVIGPFETEEESLNCWKYVKTKFFRAMVGIRKQDQGASKAIYHFVPLQNFGSTSDINWNKTISQIDDQLFAKYNLSSDEIHFIKSSVKSMDSNESSMLKKMLECSYDEDITYLIKKYGHAKHDYFKDTSCKQKNPLVSRTTEGLYCHHIDEDKAIMLSNDQYAAANPFDYQKKDRLVYCNLLEHLLLHVKIAENPNLDANENELPGIGGAINFLCKDLNDIYAGKSFADEWRQKVADAVKDDFADYIAILRHLWQIVEQNQTYKALFTKAMLCTGWDGKVVDRVAEALNE